MCCRVNSVVLLLHDHPHSIFGSAVGSKSGIWIHVFSVFKPEELRQALMPTLESLYRQDPESLPFRQPVDPMLLGIPVRNTLAPAPAGFHS